MDVGAVAGTDVYSPVDGKVVSVRPYVIDGRGHGSVIEIQPTSTPADVVTMTNVATARGIVVGTSVSAATTLLGTVVDLSGASPRICASTSRTRATMSTVEVEPAPATIGVFLRRADPLRRRRLRDSGASRHRAARAAAARGARPRPRRGERREPRRRHRHHRRLPGACSARASTCITLGNHAFRQRDVYPYLSTDQRIVRPANYPSTARAGADVRRQAATGRPCAVINLLGQLFLDPAVSPFEVVDELVARGARAQAAIVLVDFHAEATSEKVAMGRYLDGPRLGGARHAHPRADESTRRSSPGERPTSPTWA